MKINRNIPDKHKFLQITNTIAQVPKVLYSLGTIPAARGTTVAIVGTRQPTPYGKQVTFDLAYKLAQKGIVVISGLAYGIDAIAHKATLEAKGTTLAILGNGLDAIYPAAHRQLARDIIEGGGALISEYPEGTPAMKHHFLQRNRLVSSLADALIITEAGERSGTFSTVSHALEQGKEVFAVPGSITNPQSVGPNRLIQQGAHPVTCVEDILQVIAPHLLTPLESAPTGTTPEESLILSLLYNGITKSTDILEATKLSPSLYAQTLSLLEISGQIKSLGNDRWALL